MILVSVHFPLHIYEPIIRLCVMWFTLLQKNHSVLPFLLPEYLNDQTQMICLMCLPHLYTLIQREYMCFSWSNITVFSYISDIYTPMKTHSTCFHIRKH